MDRREILRWIAGRSLKVFLLLALIATAMAVRLAVGTHEGGIPARSPGDQARLTLFRLLGLESEPQPRVAVGLGRAPEPPSGYPVQREARSASTTLTK